MTVSFSNQCRKCLNLHHTVVVLVGLMIASSAIVEGRVAEVCVQVLNPPETEALAFDVFLLLETRAGTAGKLFANCHDHYDLPHSPHTDVQDFSPLNEFIVYPNSPRMTFRRNCYAIIIADDGFTEIAESFTVTLSLDNEFGLQSGILIQPNSIEIVIPARVVNDGGAPGSETVASKTEGQ